MIEISPDIYAWLSSIDMLDNLEDESNEQREKDLTSFNNAQIPKSVTNFTINSNGNITLDPYYQKQIRTGRFFVKLFPKFNSLLNSLYGNIYKDEERLTNVLNEDLPQIRLKNWELIIDVVKNYYGIILDNDYKTLIIAGDSNTFADFFQRLCNFYIEIEEKIKKEDEKRLGNQAAQIQLEKANTLAELNQQDPALPKIRFHEDFVDLDKLEIGDNEFKPITQARSVLEFIIIALCRSFSMKPKQSAALLSDNKKYITHIITKGLAKKNFKPVQQFYQEVLSNLEYFVELIQINSIAYPNQISKNIEMSLSTFKPGLLSKNIDVVYISGRVLSKLAYELIEKNLISAAWDWYVMPGGGLEASILCLKRHDIAVEVVVTLMTNFGRFHLFEMFSIYLKNFLQNDGAYFTFVADICEKISQLGAFIDEFSKNNLKKFFIDYIFEGSKSYNINEKIKCIHFLAEIWINFSIYFEDENENYEILNVFKKLARDSNRLVQYSSISQLFRILVYFAKDRNFFAPVIYKTLIFHLIEHHSDFNLKEFLITNFSQVFHVILSIPVGILAEPYIKQINVSLGTTYFFNLIDINFLVRLTRHPRLNVKDAILILDVLGKIYFDVGRFESQIEGTSEEEVSVYNLMKVEIYRGIYFYKIIKGLFTMILSRYLMHEIGVEFCFKYVKILLETFCKLDKAISERIYLNAMLLNLNPNDNQENLIFEEDLIMNEIERSRNLNLKSLTKNIIVEMILDILAINNTFMNNIIKSLLIVVDLRHYKIYNFHNLGISKILSHFGNSHEIVYYYNVNKDKLDADHDFEILIKLIYDRTPEYQLEYLKENFNTNTNINNAQANTNPQPRKPHQHKSQSKAHIPKLPQLHPVKREQIKKLNTIKDNFLLHKIITPFGEIDLKSHQKFLQHHKTTQITSKALNDNRLAITNNLINFIDLTNEEDRDIISLKILLKDYQLFFKHVFSKYLGSIYHPIQGKIFTSIKEISDTLSPTEIVKMFKENEICNKILLPEEVLLVIGLMNSKIFNKRSSKAGLNFEDFQEVFIQLAYFAFTRYPYIYCYYSISDYVKELIKYFAKTSPEKIEYRHPDELITREDAEICEIVNTKLQKSNFVKIPNGYRKYLHTEIKCKYYVPDCIYGQIGESATICLELVDELIYNIFQVHTLESFTTVKETYQVRPIINKNMPPRLIHQLGFEEDTLKIVKSKKNKKMRPTFDKTKHFYSDSEDKSVQRKRFAEVMNTISNQKLSSHKNLSEKELQLKGDEIISENTFRSEAEENAATVEDKNKEKMSVYTHETRSIQQRRTLSRSPTQITHKNIINQYKMEKLLKEENRKLFEKDREKKRKLRVQYIKQELEKMKEQNKDKQKRKSEIIEDERRKKEEVIKKKLLTEQKLREKIKADIQKYKQSKFEEKAKKI